MRLEWSLRNRATSTHAEPAHLSDLYQPALEGWSTGKLRAYGPLLLGE